MGQCKAGSTRSYTTKKGIIRRLIVSVAFHIRDQNADWALRSGVALVWRLLILHDRGNQRELTKGQGTEHMIEPQFQAIRAQWLAWIWDLSI